MIVQEIGPFQGYTLNTWRFFPKYRLPLLLEDHSGHRLSLSYFSLHSSCNRLLPDANLSTGWGMPSCTTH